MAGESKFIPSPTRTSPNPFSHTPKVSWQYYCQVLLMSLFIAPIRFVLIIICILSAYIWSKIILTGIEYDPDIPLQGWRRKGKDVAAKMVILAHFCAGWYRPVVRGHRAPPSVAPIIVAAPHTSYFDSLPFCLVGAPSVVGKNTLLDVPIIGRILTLIQPVLVDRDSSDSRRATVTKIKARVHKLADPNQTDWDQILVFPEGTCTNRTQLIQFKLGAFYPGYAVQPVAIHWPDDPNFVSWTFDGMSKLKLLWLTLCRLENHVEVEFLPVHYPTQEEKDDPKLFALNVQAKLSATLNLPCSLYSLDDSLYITKSQTPKRSKLLLLREKLGLPKVEESSASAFMDMWDSLRETFPSGHFKVDFLQFAQFLKLDPNSELVFNLFNIFDWNYCGAIDLREYLTATCSARRDTNFLRICQKTMFNSCGSKIDRFGAVCLLRLSCEKSVHSIERVFKNAHAVELAFQTLCLILLKKKRVAHVRSDRVGVSHRA